MVTMTIKWQQHEACMPLADANYVHDTCYCCFIVTQEKVEATAKQYGDNGTIIIIIIIIIEGLLLLQSRVII